MMPQVALRELLLEADSWSDSSECTQGPENAPESTQHAYLLYASLLTTSYNIPLTYMVRGSGLECKSLVCISHHYSREDALKRANSRLINYTIIAIG